MTAAKKKTNHAIETRTLPIGNRMLALEPRYVFDAAIATELHDLTTDSSHVDQIDPLAHGIGARLFAAAKAIFGGQEHETPAADMARVTTIDPTVAAAVFEHNQGVSNHEIAFIDSRLADLSTLVAAIPGATRIVLIDGSRDGVTQMVDALKGEEGVTGIHILSHGSEGHIELGTSTIDEATMESVYRSALASIHGNLAAGADILVYGCDFGKGADGARAAELLSSLTGADVAASTDLTGAADKGGNWVLEEQTGAIQSASIEASAWQHDLAATELVIAVNGGPHIVTNNDTGVGSSAVWLNAGGAGGNLFDLKATVISGNGTIDFQPDLTTFVANGYSINDPTLIVTSANSSVTVKWEVFVAGTNQTVPISGNAHLSFGDIDGGAFQESVSFLATDVTSYAVNSSTVLDVTNTGTDIVVVSQFEN